MSGDDGHDSLTPSERRLGVRHFACFPAHVHKPDGARRTAMILDMSVSGALLVVRTSLKVDDRVSLNRDGPGAPAPRPRPPPARVVRAEPLEPKAVGPWTHKMGVQFDKPLT